MLAGLKTGRINVAVFIFTLLSEWMSGDVVTNQNLQAHGGCTLKIMKASLASTVAFVPAFKERSWHTLKTRQFIL